MESPIPITSLRHAVLLSATHEDPGHFVVSAVQLRQAPALLELLIKLKRQPPGWIVGRDERLRHVSRIANEITQVGAVLSLLSDDALDPDAGRLLLRYGWSLDHISRKVDGPRGTFHGAVAQVGFLLRSHSKNLDDGTRGAAWLADNVKTLQHEVEGLMRLVVNIPEDNGGGEVDDGEGPSGGDGGDENEAKQNEQKEEKEA